MTCHMCWPRCLHDARCEWEAAQPLRIVAWTSAVRCPSNCMWAPRMGAKKCMGVLLHFAEAGMCSGWPEVRRAPLVSLDHTPSTLGKSQGDACAAVCFLAEVADHGLEIVAGRREHPCVVGPANHEDSPAVENCSVLLRLPPRCKLVRGSLRGATERSSATQSTRASARMPGMTSGDTLSVSQIPCLGFNSDDPIPPPHTLQCSPVALVVEIGCSGTVSPVEIVGRKVVVS